MLYCFILYISHSTQDTCSVQDSCHNYHTQHTRYLHTVHKIHTHRIPTHSTQDTTHSCSHLFLCPDNGLDVLLVYLPGQALHHHLPGRVVLPALDAVPLRPHTLVCHRCLAMKVINVSGNNSNPHTACHHYLVMIVVMILTNTLAHHHYLVMIVVMIVTNGSVNDSGNTSGNDNGNDSGNDSD